MPLRRFSAALADLRLGIVCLGVDGRILSANRVADTIFGYATDELVGQAIERIMPAPGSLHADFWKDFRSNPQSGTVGDGDPVVGIRRDGGPVPLEVSLNLVFLSGTRYIVASIVDLSERVELEAQLSCVTHEHQDFERLVAGIAAQFAAVMPVDVDELIVKSLGQIAEALQLDRGILWRRNRGEIECVATHYRRVGPPGNHLPPPPRLAASIPWVLSTLEAGEPCWFTNVEKIPNPVDRETFRREGPRSGAVFPLAGGRDGVLRAVAFSSMTREQEWAPAIVGRLQLVASIFSQALAHADAVTALDHALGELQELRTSRAGEGVEPRRKVRTAGTAPLIVSDSPMVKAAFAQVEEVAPTPATVLLLGETGVGKEVFAQAIHDLSSRHRRPMIRVSCSAIPSALIESELFGRERGAYTGAVSRQVGRFEMADQSTLFLDEIGELKPEVQVKLLRVLQERVIERLGSPQPIKVDVRIIAATNRNLEAAVREGTFREDLFYRLNVFPIVVPPLRERVDDIPGLVWAFIDEFSRLFGRTIQSVSKESLKELQRYQWPGNVRELRNVIERAVILSKGPHLVVGAPRPIGRTAPQAAMTLQALEVGHIREVLESTNWRVRGAGGAAARLGLKPTTLESRMAKLGITRRAAS